MIRWKVQKVKMTKRKSSPIFHLGIPPEGELELASYTDIWDTIHCHYKDGNIISELDQRFADIYIDSRERGWRQ